MLLSTLSRLPETSIFTSRRHFLAYCAASVGSTLSIGGLAEGLETSRIELVRLLSGYPPGGTTDTIARRVAERLRTNYAKNIVVDTKTDAAGQISDDAYRLLMASVDRRISLERKPQEQMALRQDKMVFALMRVMGWSARRVCRLTIRELEALLPRPKEAPHLGSTTAPLEVASVCSHSWRFVESIRPKIPGAQVTDRLVVSPTTGRPLGGNAVWLRFRRAVSEACLTGEIPDLIAFRRLETSLRLEGLKDGERNGLPP